MSLATFYSNPDLADGFGATAGRVRPHGGTDFPHGFGTAIPALFSGVVVAKGVSAELGCYTQIKAANGKVFTYCHSANPSPLDVGDHVAQGETVNYVADRGYATGPHLHLAVGNTLAVGYSYCEDPMPWVRKALAGEDIASGGYAPAPSSGVLGPIVRSGADWAYRRPQGDLAKRVANALIGKGRLPADYNNDGDPREVFDTAVQVTLNYSGMFRGLEDGVIERGGCYGIQDYAIAFGDYSQHGGVRDGRPEVLSWSCFALGLERP
ncbi:M23 family metallopeptidase [Agromyces sp. G08B096]|uniref:M23 family metallopeptidase n=1 Tax=Agromyces sp. G08B096 TaxID=3156399 RepID=A0AAU7W5U8_9MICO